MYGRDRSELTLVSRAERIRRECARSPRPSPITQRDVGCRRNLSPAESRGYSVTGLEAVGDEVADYVAHEQPAAD